MQWSIMSVLDTNNSDGGHWTEMNSEFLFHSGGQAKLQVIEDWEMV